MAVLAGRQHLKEKIVSYGLFQAIKTIYGDEEGCSWD